MTRSARNTPRKQEADRLLQESARKRREADALQRRARAIMDEEGAGHD